MTNKSNAGAAKSRSKSLPPAEVPTAVQPPAKRLSKANNVVALLSADQGATLAEIGAATGWQVHSCRAFLAGLRKKGRSVERSHRTDGTSVYRLVTVEAAAQ